MVAEPSVADCGMRYECGSVESFAQICEGTQSCMPASAWKEADRIVELEREKEQLDDDWQPVQVMDTEARKVIAVMLVRDSVRNRMAGQCSGIQGCLNANPLKSNGVNDVLKEHVVSADVWRRLSTRVSKTVVDTLGILCMLIGPVTPRIVRCRLYRSPPPAYDA